MISSKPSSRVGALKRRAKSPKAIPGREVRDSGFWGLLMRIYIRKVLACTSSLFDARTALLCLHRSGVEMNWTQRMGTLTSFARSVQ